MTISGAKGTVWIVSSVSFIDLASLAVSVFIYNTEYIPWCHNSRVLSVYAKPALK